MARKMYGSHEHAYSLQIPPDATTTPCKFNVGDRVEVRRGKHKGTVSTVEFVYRQLDDSPTGLDRKLLYGQDFFYWVVGVDVRGTNIEFREGSLAEFLDVSPEAVIAAKRELLATLRGLDA